MSSGNTSYLEQLDRTLPSEQYPLLLNWIYSSPKPLFEELRRDRPIVVTEMGTLAARFDDVVDLLSHPDVFTVKPYVSKLGPDFMLSQDDTALHTREKAVMQSMLNRDDLPAVRKVVKDRTNEFLDAGQGKLDLVPDFGRAVPVALVQDYFGYEDSSTELLKEWSYWIQYDSFHNHPFSLPKEPKKISEKAGLSRKALAEYLTQLVPKVVEKVKAGKPPKTIIGRMLMTQYPEDVGFPIQNAVRNMSGLLIGAVETTSQAAVQIVQHLLRLPDELSQAVALAQADDEKFDGYVWEALRFHPIAPYLFRESVSDYDLARGKDHSVTIPSGTTVMPLIASAMFDPSKFPDPYTFNPNRPWFDTFHLGFGLHECLGKYIALVMIPEMVKQLLLRPGLKADGPIDYQEGPFPESFPVSWDT